MDRLRSAYQEYPRPFWTLMGVVLVDQLGKWMLFPFFALYATQRFGITMTQTGLILGLFFVAGFAGKLVAGAAADRFGRRSMIILGLLLSAGTSLAMGLANDPQVFLIMVGIAGLTSSLGDPAQQAIIADLLPEDQRADGFGWFRVTYNIATTLGPLVGGLLALQSYLALFIFDAVFSVLAALIARTSLPETRPQLATDSQNEPMVVVIKGYRQIVKDRRFMLFFWCTVLMVIAYIQTYATLSVYMRDFSQLSPNWYSYLLSMNSLTVVTLQIWFSRKIKRFAPMAAMAAGTGLIGIGLGVYALAAHYLVFVIGMLLITVGEMATAPVGGAIIADMAPESMRARYAASYSLSWSVANAVGPFLAGVVMDNFNPQWVWVAASLVGLAAAAGYAGLHTTALSSQGRNPNPACVDVS